ncbi:MAG: hypothetical protein L0Y72_05945 [Gemmataceae bacterium]|nr:hypothetical protein [Gemmataceae bacterium]MCI0738567.1 hypothetical protein [Gemmataceae bacterium]
MSHHTRFQGSLRAYFLCGLLSLCGAAFTRSGEQEAGPSIVPDEKIQSLISRAVILVKDEVDADARTALKSLNDMAARIPEVLAPQLIYHSLHSSDETSALGSIVLMGHLGTKWESQMRQALIPFLEMSDKKAVDEVSMWLHGIDSHKNPSPESNVLYYRETLLRQKKTPPAGLVDYVFDISPSRALLLLGEIYSKEPKFGNWPRDLMWSDHVVTTVGWRASNRFLQEGDLEKARKELDHLSKHEGWYARRYVVEILGGVPRFHGTWGNPKLGTPEIIERLTKDSHPLVRERAKLLK